MRHAAFLLAAALVSLPAFAAPQITGYYVETRTCDVYTGPCFANSEIGLTGKEAILAWVVDKGAWNGVSLDGLSVIAAVRAEGTLDDTRRDTGATDAVLIVDERADAAQRAALADMAKALSNGLVVTVAQVRTAAIDANVGTCSKNGCAEVKAEGLVEISTRCLNNGDHICGNEETYYPPLTNIENATPAYTEVSKFEGKDLGKTWQDVGSRSAFLGSFAA
ncbi:MAG: DUF1326 domain-containing protein [FCB group bacterium]|jgi:hypothetical protein|nr:DUF1326 domain-containing protein [FCB group bacterium]